MVGDRRAHLRSARRRAEYPDRSWRKRWTKIAAAKPAAVAIDVTLHDAGGPGEGRSGWKRRCARRPIWFCPAEIVDGAMGRPSAALQDVAAVAIGHVAPEIETRRTASAGRLPLEESPAGSAAGLWRSKRFAVARGQPIIESPDDVQVGDT